MPVTVAELAAMVIWEDWVLEMEDGLKLTVKPFGWPLAVSATAELNPPATTRLRVEEALALCTTFS